VLYLYLRQGAPAGCPAFIWLHAYSWLWPGSYMYPGQGTRTGCPAILGSHAYFWLCPESYLYPRLGTPKWLPCTHLVTCLLPVVADVLHVSESRHGENAAIAFPGSHAFSRLWLICHIYGPDALRAIHSSATSPWPAPIPPGFGLTPACVLCSIPIRAAWHLLVTLLFLAVAEHSHGKGALPADQWCAAPLGQHAYSWW
jgi:hypothetical protein